MILQKYVSRLDGDGKLAIVTKSVSRNLEMAGVLKALEPKPVLFTNIAGFEVPVVGNLFCTKEQIASYFGINSEEVIRLLARAIDGSSSPEIIDNAPCQDVVENTVNLDRLPILIHNKVERGPYITAGVVVSSDPEYGQNLDFHRAMQLDKNRMVTRVVRGHDFHKFLEKNGEVDVAFCIGNTPEILIAAATTVEIGKNELNIANALGPIKVTRAKTTDLLIPADCEYVLEGRVVWEEKYDEGPFVDITETADMIRQEPLFEVKRITHRSNPIWQALLPGQMEHKMLMGMPREPTVFKKVAERGVEVLDVHITPGGTSWLHIAVKIRKMREDDGMKAIEGAFEGHRSGKHVWIYDEDIDIYNEQNREWAMATRFQGDTNMLVKDREPGSSLDPSAEPGTKLTTKIGFDTTKPLVVKGKNFERVDFPKVEIDDYLHDIS
ncbi:MAG: UbiD family decarboxylase [Candidatus Thorarchaeota archaeon]|nr:UbiD family decarboxylase [Candidatus Thorarchaeota archaeon]